MARHFRRAEERRAAARACDEQWRAALRVPAIGARGICLSSRALTGARAAPRGAGREPRVLLLSHIEGRIDTGGLLSRPGKSTQTPAPVIASPVSIAVNLPASRAVYGALPVAVNYAIARLISPLFDFLFYSA